MIAFLKTRANIKYKILNIIYIVILLATHAQGQNKYDYTIVSDTTINTVTRSISEEKIKKYRSNPAYNYEQNPDYEETGLRKLWMRFLRWLEDVLGDGGYSILGDIVYYGLILVAVVTLIMIILRAQGHNPFARRERKSKTAIAADTIDENSSVASCDY